MQHPRPKQLCSQRSWICSTYTVFIAGRRGKAILFVLGLRLGELNSLKQGAGGEIEHEPDRPRERNAAFATGRSHRIRCFQS